MSFTVPTDVESNLWNLYALKVKRFLEPSGLLSKDTAIFIPPFNSLGPPIGTTPHPANTNSQIFKLGDMLLPADVPVFTPGPSYSQRLWRYLNAVQVSGKQSSASLQRLQDRNRDLAQAGDDFLDSRRRALTAYSDDPEKLKYSFEEWVDKYFPEYMSDLDQVGAAREAATQASKEYYGPYVDQVRKDKEKVEKALRLDKSFPGYNMAVSSTDASSQTNEKDLKALTYRPTFEFNGDYRAISQDWLVTAFEHGVNMFELAFSASDEDSHVETWQSLGHDDSDWKAEPLLSSSLQSKASLPEKKGKITVSITATDAQVLQISAGPWDIEDVVKTYPRLRADAMDTNLMDPMLSFSERATFEAIRTTLRTTEQGRGQCNLFGLAIGGNIDTDESANKIVEQAATVPFNAVEFHETQTDCSITIPWRDSIYSRLLAVKGKRLDVPKAAKTSE